MADYEYIGSGQDDGMIIGRSGGAIGFFETTPATVASVTAAAVTATASQTSGGGSWGYATQAQAQNIAEAVREIRAALVAYGLLSEASS
jgi:UDP-N-acetyl-D-mannosaminuronic acid transferase (WecB/TagA/CpsF family)